MKKTTFIIVVGFLSLMSQKTNAQQFETGVYFLREDIDSCPYSLKDDKTSKIYCTGNTAIIPYHDFDDISEIYTGDKVSFFKITLSTVGQQQLKSILITKIQMKLGLVNNGSLIGIIDTENISNYQKIEISALSFDNDLPNIRTSLISTIDNK